MKHPNRLLLPAMAMLFAVFISGCKKDQSATSMTTDSYTTPTTSAKAASSFRQPNTQLKGVDLGLAGEFVILSKSGITNVYKSSITGDIGTSPITGAAIHLTCAEVTGNIFSVDAAGPLPCAITNATRLTSSVSNMQTAYTDAAGRSNPDFVNLGAGNIGGATLTPGLYTWTSALIIPTDITITGGPDDVFIFQIAGTLNAASAVNITLAGGAQAKNISFKMTCST